MDRKRENDSWQQGDMLNPRALVVQQSRYLVSML